MLALLVNYNVTARRFAKVKNQSEKSGGSSSENTCRSRVARSTELSHGSFFAGPGLLADLMNSTSVFFFLNQICL